MSASAHHLRKVLAELLTDLVDVQAITVESYGRYVRRCLPLVAAAAPTHTTAGLGGGLSLVLEVQREATELEMISVLGTEAIVLGPGLDWYVETPGGRRVPVPRATLLVGLGGPMVDYLGHRGPDGGEA